MDARQANTPALWDGVWGKDTMPEADRLMLAKEACGIRWQRIERIILKRFGGFAGLRVIELGAGAGTNAALMAKRGAQVTVLDSSEQALIRARQVFERFGVSGSMRHGDVLALPASDLETYDVSMSFGLAEHFRGDSRAQVVKAHVDLVRPGGLALISVPNAWNPPYRVYKFIAERTGHWGAGEEYPFSRIEFTAMCRALGILDHWFIGDSFMSSFEFVDPMRLVRKLLKIRNSPATDVRRLRAQRGTPLDQYLSYALVLCVTKSQQWESVP